MRYQIPSYNAIDPIKRAELIARRRDLYNEGQKLLEAAREHIADHEISNEKITQPEDVVNLLLPYMTLLDHEEMWILAINSQFEIMSITKVYKGGRHEITGISLPDLFRLAIIQDSYGIFLVHNHPSGNVTPSPSDDVITDSAVVAGNLLNVRVADHIIIGKTGKFYSYMKKGKILNENLSSN